MQKDSASIRYICLIYVANASIAIRSLTSEMKPQNYIGYKHILLFCIFFCFFTCTNSNKINLLYVWKFSFIEVKCGDIFGILLLLLDIRESIQQFSFGFCREKVVGLISTYTIHILYFSSILRTKWNNLTILFSFLWV